jgi:hypothetical protein
VTARHISTNVALEEQNGRRHRAVLPGNAGCSGEDEGARGDKHQGMVERGVAVGKRRVVLDMGVLLVGVGLWRLTASWFAQFHVDDVRATISAFGPIAPLV